MYDGAGRVVSVVRLDVGDGVVQAIRSVTNADKLSHIGPVSDVARLPERESASAAEARRHHGLKIP
jgi:RNA polymerase sigma-70 factor (ECF subfamily)